MVAHKHVAVELDRVDREGLAEDLEETLPVGVVLIDVFPFIAPAGDVVGGRGRRDTGREEVWPWAYIAGRGRFLNNEDLTLGFLLIDIGWPSRAFPVTPPYKRITHTAVPRACRVAPGWTFGSLRADAGVAPR